MRIERGFWRNIGGRGEEGGATYVTVALLRHFQGSRENLAHAKTHGGRRDIPAQSGAAGTAPFAMQVAHKTDSEGTGR